MLLCRLLRRHHPFFQIGCPQKPQEQFLPLHQGKSRTGSSGYQRVARQKTASAVTAFRSVFQASPVALSMGPFHRIFFACKQVLIMDDIDDPCPSCGTRWDLSYHHAFVETFGMDALVLVLISVWTAT